MLNALRALASAKREYRQQLARAKLLPADYRFVLEKMFAYMWSRVGGSGVDMIRVQSFIVSLFEEGASKGQQVLEVTGNDVAAFCDQLMEESPQWVDPYRKRANRF